MEHHKGPATLSSIFCNHCICTWQQTALHCRISQSISWEQLCKPSGDERLQRSKFESQMQVPNSWLLSVKPLCAWHQLGSAQHLLLRTEAKHWADALMGHTGGRLKRMSRCQHLL